MCVEACVCLCEYACQGRQNAFWGMPFSYAEDFVLFDFGGFPCIMDALPEECWRLLFSTLTIYAKAWTCHSCKTSCGVFRSTASAVEACIRKVRLKCLEDLKS